jgi:hypothetical protein
MAEVVPIQGASSTAKVRNPLGVVALGFITLGVYFWFWYYFVNREMRDLGEAHGTSECGTSPGTSLLAVTFGALIIVPPFISIYKSFKRMNEASRITGAGDGFDAGLGILLWIFISPIAIYLFQQNLNKVWNAQSGPAAAVSAPEPAQVGTAPAETVESSPADPTPGT